MPRSVHVSATRTIGQYQTLAQGPSQSQVCLMRRNPAPPPTLQPLRTRLRITQLLDTCFRKEVWQQFQCRVTRQWGRAAVRLPQVLNPLGVQVVPVPCTAQELHQRMNAVPTADRCVVVDSPPAKIWPCGTTPQIALRRWLVEGRKGDTHMVAQCNRQRRTGLHVLQDAQQMGNIQPIAASSRGIDPVQFPSFDAPHERLIFSARLGHRDRSRQDKSTGHEPQTGIRHDVHDGRHSQATRTGSMTRPAWRCPRVTAERDPHKLSPHNA